MERRRAPLIRPSAPSPQGERKAIAPCWKLTGGGGGLEEKPPRDEKSGASALRSAPATRNV